MRPADGRALALIHQAPLERWTVGRLAREAALSRSPFLRRFRALMGRPPIAYVAALRISLAKAMLRETTQSIAQIAGHLSYDSEAAFSRAFKRAVGAAPRVWRRGAAAIQ